MARTMAAQGVDPAFAYGAADVGYLVTEANRHLYTALQIEALPGRCGPPLAPGCCAFKMPTLASFRMPMNGVWSAR
jgi:hypothetical protein